MSIVPYHLEIDDRFYSLQYVYDDLEDISSEDLWGERDVVIQPLDLPQRCYGLYRLSEVPTGLSDGDNISTYPETTQEIVKVILAQFDTIDQTASLSWYKPLNKTAIADAIESVTWRQSVVEVASELLSNLILSHGLPNANHRTSIAFLDLYFNSLDDIRQPETGTEGEWANWANDFIRRSKCYLTCRRKAPLFRYLKQKGATGIKRKSNLVITFDRYPVDYDDHWSFYGDRHLIQCRRFVNRYLNMAGAYELREKRDRGKRVFANRL